MICETHTRKVICDLCGKEIKEFPLDNVRVIRNLFTGIRFYVVAGIFGKKVHADICAHCVKKIREITRKDQNEKVQTDSAS